MPDEAHHFWLEPDLTPRDVARMLGAGSAHVRKRPPRVERTWFDTFDRRLRAGGWDLQRVRAGGEERLILSRRQGDQRESPVTAAPDSVSAEWGGNDPGPARTLPDPVRQPVADLIDDRTLLPMGGVSSRQWTIPVLNEDDKTVARAVIEEWSTGSRSRPAPLTSLSVVPLRGYGSEAARAAAGLARDERLVPTLMPMQELADRLTPGPPPSPDVMLDPELPAGTAARAVLVRLLDIFTANLDGTVRDLDDEFLHDLRVAVRRARSLVKLAGDALDPALAADLAAGLKRLGDLTTPTRDLDVYLSDLAGRDTRGDALKPFQALLQEGRAFARAELVKGLGAKSTKSLIGLWRSLETGGGTGPAGARPIGPLAASRTRAAHRRVLTLGRKIDDSSAPEKLHDLRKRCKELRYLLEIFSSLHAGDSQKALVSELKKLQDCLGDYQDSQVQIDALSRFATQMVDLGPAGADSILAMGALSAELQRRQDDARSRFGTVFGRFDRPANQQRLDSMLAHLGGSFP